MPGGRSSFGFKGGNGKYTKQVLSDARRTALPSTIGFLASVWSRFTGAEALAVATTEAVAAPADALAVALAAVVADSPAVALGVKSAGGFRLIGSGSAQPIDPTTEAVDSVNTNAGLSCTDLSRGTTATIASPCDHPNDHDTNCQL